MSTIIQQRKPPRWLIPPSPRTRRNLLNRQCWVRAWRKPSFCHPRRSDCNWSGPANQPRWEKKLERPPVFFVTWHINLGLTLKPKRFYRFAWFTFIRLSQEVLWLGLLHDWIPICEWGKLTSKPANGHDLPEPGKLLKTNSDKKWLFAIRQQQNCSRVVFSFFSLFSS